MFRLPLLIALLLGWTAGLAADDRAEERFSAYLQGAAYRALLAERIEALRQGLLRRCAGPIEIAQTDHREVPADPSFVDGREAPVSGQWTLRFAVSGCRHMTLINLLAVAQPEGPPSFIGTLPGTTRTDPNVQRTVINSLAARATVEAPDGCNPLDSGLAFDTAFDRYVAEPRTLPQGGVQAMWLETWTVILCTDPVPFRILFMRNDPMGTDFRIEKAEAVKE